MRRVATVAALYMQEFVLFCQLAITLAVSMGVLHLRPGLVLVILPFVSGFNIISLKLLRAGSCNKFVYLVLPLIVSLLLSSGLHRAQQTAEFGSLLMQNNHATVSVVIPARNEAAYIAKTVFYTLHGVHADVLREVILVDDASPDPVSDLINKALAPGGDLDIVSATDRAKVKVIRLDERQGLTRAKIIGAEAALGTHILFLDGHCRIVPGAVESMIDTMGTNYKRIVVPIVTTVKGDGSWQHLSLTGGTKMMFHWNFEFEWLYDDSDLVPVLSGGLLLISKRWWSEGGGYDPGMLEWGAENIEQSLRTWQCGGEILVDRQAKIGHIFDRPEQVNKTSNHTVQRNHARAALAFLDDRLTTFEASHSVAKAEIPYVGEYFSDRLSLRHKLGCKGFDFFENKFKQYFDTWAMNTKDRFSLQHDKSGLCLTVYRVDDPTAPSGTKKKKNRDVPAQVSLSRCETNNLAQTWAMIHGGKRLFSPSFQRCLDRGGKTAGRPILYKCDFGENRNQYWQWEGEQLTSISGAKKLRAENMGDVCLSGPERMTNVTGVFPASFSACDGGDLQTMSKIYPGGSAP